MTSLQQVSVAQGARTSVPTAPLTHHLAGVRSNRPALVYSDETATVQISYEELHARTNALAKVIAARARPTGANRDGDYVIAVCMQPTHNTVLALLALWKAGAAYVPMEPSFPQALISHILNDAVPSLVIYDENANPSTFAGSGVPSISYEELSQDCAAVTAEDPTDMETLAPCRSDSIAIVLYTSGSTGIPKGVRLPYSGICNRLWWQFRTFPYSDSELTCVWKTALSFLDSVCEIWGPLLHGRTLLILSKDTTRDPQKLVRVLAENQIQRLVLVPTLLRSILMYLSLNPSERPLQLLKLWVCSGEVLSKNLAEQFFKYFGDQAGYKLANFYGSTEVMGDVTFYVIENSEQLELYDTIPIGSPLDNCAIYLLDEEMNLVRESELGEVWVAGSHLAAGYVGGQDPEKFWDNPHATQPEFARLFRTGDFGVVHKGVILYAGRTDSQIKIRGHRVDLLEVERAVSNVPGVDKENIPLLVNGKTDRQSLLKMYENNNADTSITIEYDYSGIKPEEIEMARVLFETVEEVLGRSARGAMSIRAGFYELGGNSLNSICTIVKLREKGYFIDVSDFLESANLGEMLSHLSINPVASEEKESKFVAELIRGEHKQHVIDIIATAFYEKPDLLAQNLKQKVEARDYADIVEFCWDAILQARLSVVLKDTKNALNEDAPVAVAINCDMRDRPDSEVTPSGGIAKMKDLITHVENAVDNMLPEGKETVLYAFVMATADHLSARDNVSAIRALEHATLRVARDNGFRGVFTINSNPLTQQLGTHVLGFQTLLDYQINQYVDPNGERPFSKATDDMRVIACWKTVD